MTLADRIRSLIRREGPIDVGRYMDLCLHDPDGGYYATRPALGERGDFITAPMVSQMFGEALGLWAAAAWATLGRPRRCVLAEIGPGHGVMMADMLRAARVAPGFRDTVEVWLIETSAPLRARQTETLAGVASPSWTEDLAGLPSDAPLILIANEYLDCLPIRQAVRGEDGWRERRVGLAADGSLIFEAGAPIAAPPGAPGEAPLGAVAEWSDAVAKAGEAIGARLSQIPGVALYIDYGRDRPDLGDTFQALRGHRRESPLARPGEADVTAHVDFPAFLAGARAAGAQATSIRRQGDFLLDLGLGVRAEALIQANPARAAMIGRQRERLTASDQMGDLFKVAAVASPGFVTPGFPIPVYEGAP